MPQSEIDHYRSSSTLRFRSGTSHGESRRLRRLRLANSTSTRTGNMQEVNASPELDIKSAYPPQSKDQQDLNAGRADKFDCPNAVAGAWESKAVRLAPRFFFLVINARFIADDLIQLIEDAFAHHGPRCFNRIDSQSFAYGIPSMVYATSSL